FSPLAASPSNLSFPNPPPSKTLTAFTSGLPSVSVPVLSTTSVSTLARVSSASAFRTSTPACAPRPTATIIDIGVASPSAQGQAMIKTDTAATSAWAKRGSGPKNIQPANARTAAATTAGTKYEATRSARRALAGTHAQSIAALDLVKRHVFFRSVRGNNVGLPRRKMQKRTDRPAGALPGAQFQNLAEQNKCCDHCGRFKISRRSAAQVAE